MTATWPTEWQTIVDEPARQAAVERQARIVEENRQRQGRYAPRHLAERRPR